MTEIEEASVLTLVKGRGDHLRQQLLGLARGTRRPRECIVVNMGGGDLSLPELDFPLVLHDMTSPGLPLAAARNAAAGLARAPVLIFLDVDCVPSANLVEALAADVRGAEGLICCEVLYLPARARGIEDEARLRALGVPHEVRHFPPEGLRREENAGLFWSLAFAMRRDTFHALGGFDAGFEGYGGEDTDFAFRARQAGIPLLFTGSTRAFHQHHAIHDPPLNHFADILANAERFRSRHGVWPMEGWLNAFAAMGLIAPPGAGERLHVIRAPTPAEVAASAGPPDRPY